MSDEAKPDAMDLVKRYTGTVVDNVARAMAVIAIDTRPAKGDKIGEAAKTALRVTEAARLLCAVGSDQPFEYLSAEEQSKLRELLDLYTPMPEELSDD